MPFLEGYSRPADRAYTGIAHPILPEVGPRLGLSIMGHDCPDIDREFGVTVFKGIKICLIILANLLALAEANSSGFVCEATKNFWNLRMQLALEFLGVVATLRSGHLECAEYDEDRAAFTFVLNGVPGYQMMRGRLDGTFVRYRRRHGVGFLPRAAFVPNPMAPAFFPASSRTDTASPSPGDRSRKVRFDVNSEGEDCPFVILPGEVAAFDTCSDM